MLISIYTIEGCDKCKEAIEKITAYCDNHNSNHGPDSQIEIVKFDTSTEEGLAESAFHGIDRLPGVVIETRSITVFKSQGIVPSDKQLDLIKQ